MDTLPRFSSAFGALMRADFTTQWRNRRSFILVLFVPLIILITWKGLIARLGGPFTLASCITIGLVAIGLMGYSNSVARDRGKGVFQRLRVAPIHNWLIMLSRLSVQLAMILILTIACCLGGYYIDHISLSFQGYAITFITALMGGSVYLGIGQTIVGLIENPETVNSTSRLIYFLFILVGMFGGTGLLGEGFRQIVDWTPYGSVESIITSGMEPERWGSHASLALLVTVSYALLFTYIGIRNFKWGTK